MDGKALIEGWYDGDTETEGEKEIEGLIDGKSDTVGMELVDGELEGKFLGILGIDLNNVYIDRFLYELHWQ